MNIKDAIKIAHEQYLVCCDNHSDFEFTKRLLSVTKMCFTRKCEKPEKWIIDNLLISNLEEWFFNQLSSMGGSAAKCSNFDNLILLGLPVVFEEDIMGQYLSMYKKEEIFFPSNGRIQTDSFIIIAGANEALFGGYKYK